MKTIRYVSLILFLSLFFPKLTNAASYYVSTSGLDTNNGTSSNTPFKNFSKAQTVAFAGDTIHVLPGTYNYTFRVTKNGLTIIGQNVIVDATGKFFAIEIPASNIKMSGFDATNATGHSVFISGKNIEYSNFVVRNSVNENRGSNGFCGSASGWGSGLKLYVGAENIHIHDGLIFNNCGEGFATTRGVNVTIENVTAYDNYSVNLYIDNSKNVTMRNNLSYCTNDTRYFRSGNPAAGILMGEEEYSGWGTQLENVKVLNNIVYGCSGISFYGSEFPTGGMKGGLIAHNTVLNVIGSTRGIRIADEPANRDIQIVNNLTSSAIVANTGATMNNNLASSNIITAPNYTNILSFMPPSNSPAVNGGVDVGVTTDFRGISRPQGGGFDIGALELTSGSSPSGTPIYNIADLEPDGDVDGSDFLKIISDFTLTGIAGWIRSDIIKNGVVDIFDFNKLVTNFGQ